MFKINNYLRNLKNIFKFTIADIKVDCECFIFLLYLLRDYKLKLQFDDLIGLLEVIECVYVNFSNMTFKFTKT